MANNCEIDVLENVVQVRSHGRSSEACAISLLGGHHRVIMVYTDVILYLRVPLGDIVLILLTVVKEGDLNRSNT